MFYYGLVLYQLQLFFIFAGGFYSLSFRMSIELVCIIINNWDFSLVEKHSCELTNSIKLALSDADSEARLIARQSFESLQNIYPSKAELLFQVFLSPKIYIFNFKRSLSQPSKECLLNVQVLLHQLIPSILSVTIFQIQIEDFIMHRILVYLFRFFE